jgi:tRNA A37 methylthiotransferase MiaB
MICPYSNRDNAPAKKLPNHVDENIIKDRIILCRTLIQNIDNQDSVQLPNIRTFKINLYNDKEVARLYRYLDETNDSMILEVDYDYYGDNEKFEINNKMLAIRFGVIYKINFINKEPKYINDFCEYMNGVKNNA